MSDNGKEIQPEEQLIFKAVLRNGKNIHLEVSNAMQMTLLCYAFKLLSVEIDKGIITAKLAQMQSSKILTPQKHGILDFIRKK